MPQERMNQNHEEQSEEAVQAIPTESVATEGLDDDVDAILNEIDDVLETNAEEFVRNYIQKGGQ